MAWIEYCAYDASTTLYIRFTACPSRSRYLGLWISSFFFLCWTVAVNAVGSVAKRVYSSLKRNNYVSWFWLNFSFSFVPILSAIQLLWNEKRKCTHSVPCLHTRIMLMKRKSIIMKCEHLNVHTRSMQYAKRIDYKFCRHTSNRSHIIWNFLWNFPTHFPIHRNYIVCPTFIWQK